MANLGQMLKQLQVERKHTQKELEHLDAVIAAFEKLVRTNSGGRTHKGPRTRRKLSAAARRKIAKAQRARWAKLRREQSKS